MKIANAFLSADIASLGAELQTLVTADGTNWLWNGDPAVWSGRSPLLFPVVGKSPDGAVTIEGRPYPMLPHGFARRSTFEITRSDEAVCTLLLRDSDATRENFPFAFALTVTYRVDGLSLVVDVEVENRDNRPMPFGFGFHPAFVWPLPGSAGLPHEVVLDNGAAPALIRLGGDGLIDPRPLPSPFVAGHLALAHAQFDADAMIFPRDCGAGASFSAIGGAALEMSWKNLPNFAVWQKPGAGFLCLEPWHGMAAESGSAPALEERPGTILLPAGEKAEFQLRIRPIPKV